MENRRAMAVIVLALLLAGSLSLSAESRTADQELFNEGKILIFDKNWEAARAVFQRVVREFPQSALVPQARYFQARCYQFEGKGAEAIHGYEEFLRLYPDEPFLPGEARNSVIELAASLLERGDASFRDRLVSGLGNSNKDVRYFAAIRCSRLKDRKITSLAVQVLKEIINKESERELVDRARIALLRLDPKGLARQAEAPEKDGKQGSRGTNKMFHLEVFEAGSSRPSVELNIPLNLAQLAIMALDDSKKKELRKQGFDIDNIWESLNRMSPTEILTFRSGGETVKLWIK